MGWNDAAWDELVSDLYLSAIDREAGARLPGRFAALTGGVVASLWRLRPHDNAVVGELSTNLPPEALAAYREHYYQHDPLAHAVRQASGHSVLQGDEFVDASTLVRSIYYNEFGIHHGLFHMIGALVPLGVGRAAHVGAISILRPREATGFDQPAVAALGRALPHIAAAFRLREQLQTAEATRQNDTLDAALDGFGIPAVVLDGHGTVLRTNVLAEEISCVRDAMSRRTNPHGVMRLPAGPGHERWAGLIAATARGEPGGKFHLVDRALAYLGTVTPLPARLSALTGGTSGRVLLLLRPLGPQDRAALAATLFCLTRAEADVAASLADGLSPAEIAAARGVKISTARTLLQRAQDKAGCRNLRDLVGLLASLD